MQLNFTQFSLGDFQYSNNERLRPTNEMTAYNDQSILMQADAEMANLGVRRKTLDHHDFAVKAKGQLYHKTFTHFYWVGSKKLHNSV